MEDNLISKKELLELTNISYGQLYRWKRKGLIPEDWFVKKSTFTGQETFFPKSKILMRIDKIKNMKDDISLDDLADVFSPTLDNINLGLEEMAKRNIVTNEVLKIYLEIRGDIEVFNFHDILSAYVLNKLIIAGDISLDEGKLLLEVLSEGLMKFESHSSEVYLMRKLGIFSCFIITPPCQIYFDKGTRLIGKVSISAIIEELKLKLV